MQAAQQPVQSGMVRFVLVGGREGFSGYLGGANVSKHKFAFSQGVCILPFQEAELSKQVLAFFAAYPEGSQELMDAQTKWEDAQGEKDGSTKTPTIHGGVRQAGQEPSEGNAAAGSGDGETAQGESRSVPERDGLQRTSYAMSIPDALAIFDHSKPEQWTTGGKPILKLVQQLCQSEDITRADVDEFGITRNS